MSKMLSIILSTHNSSEFLQDTVEAICNQTFSDFELIIIDDFSSDNTNILLEKLKEKDKRIRLISNNKNIGLTKSLNIGIKVSRGKYIARIDTGDISSKSRFEKQVGFLERSPNTFLVGSWATAIDGLGEKIGFIKSPVTPRKINRILSRTNCIIHSSIIFRSHPRLFYREKFYYAQDYDFYLRLLTNKRKIEILPQPLISYRILKNSISVSQTKKQELFATKAREFYFQRKKTGKDFYHIFNPNKILSLRFKNTNFISSQIILLLRFHAFSRASKLLKDYWQGKESIWKKCLLIIFVRLPFTYKLYRFFRYEK